MTHDEWQAWIRRASRAIGDIATAIADWQQRQLMDEEQERLEWELFHAKHSDPERIR